MNNYADPVMQALDVPPLDSYDELEMRCQVAMEVTSEAHKATDQLPPGYGRHMQERQVRQEWAVVSVLYEELSMHAQATASRRELAEKLCIEAARKAGLPLRVEALTARLRSKYPLSIPRG